MSGGSKSPDRLQVEYVNQILEQQIKFDSQESEKEEKGNDTQGVTTEATDNQV